MLSLILSLVPILLILAAEPAPSPVEVPHASPLTEIGRTRNAPLCTPIVVRANSTITTALDNDRTLAALTHNLRATNYDGLNSMQRRNAVEELLKEASSIRTNGRTADALIKQLRAYAASSPDPERKAELKTFTDALGGAILRQVKEATELVSAVTIMQGRDEVDEARGIMKADNPQLDSSGFLPNKGAAMVQSTPAPPVLPGGVESYNAYLRELADGLSERSAAIAGDEGVAADHSIAATSGC